MNVCVCVCVCLCVCVCVSVCVWEVSGTRVCVCVWREGGVQDDPQVSGLDSGQVLIPLTEKGRKAGAVVETSAWQENRGATRGCREGFHWEKKGLGNLQRG